MALCICKINKQGRRAVEQTVNTLKCLSQTRNGLPGELTGSLAGPQAGETDSMRLCQSNKREKAESTFHRSAQRSTWFSMRPELSFKWQDHMRRGLFITTEMSLYVWKGLNSAECQSVMTVTIPTVDLWPETHCQSSKCTGARACHESKSFTTQSMYLSFFGGGFRSFTDSPHKYTQVC